MQQTPRHELARRLLNRYREQCLHYPRTAEISPIQYIQANLKTTVRNDKLAWLVLGHGALEAYKSI